LAGSGGQQAARARVRLEPWGPDYLPLLRQGVGDPAMMLHLGGPESEAKIAERQGKGIAAARQLLERVRADGALRFVYAYPSVDNAPSNAIPRTLGFELVEEAREFEYPKGSFMRCNVWRFDLSGGQPTASSGTSRQ